MGDRQISNHQRQWLTAELAAWSDAGVIGAGQIERILGCYESVADSGQRKHSTARFALQGISAFLVGLAALLVIGYNWQELHWGVKLVLVFGSVTLTHAIGFYLRFFTSARRLSEVAFFLGCLFYGAGIWLVAQVFHLDSHYPDGLWWWAVGVMPFALCLDTLLVHALLVGLLATWAGIEVTGFSHLPPWWMWNWWPNGAYSLPLLAAPGLVWAYRRESAATVGLYAALLAWWVVLQALGWNLEWQAIYLTGAMGAIFLIVAENHRHGSPLAMPYRICGALMVAGAMVPPSFYDFQKHVRRYSSRGLEDVQALAEAVLFLVLLAAMIAFSFLLRPLGARTGQNPFARLVEILRRQWVPFGLLLVMVALALLSFTSQEGLLAATVAANIGMIAFAIWLMRVGLREEQGRLFAAGVLYFLLWSVLRYVDLFGEAGGMLGAALMFFLCGAGLFGLATYWGKRKEIGHA
jgi:uncharacterized membrane protein